MVSVSTGSTQRIRRRKSIVAYSTTGTYFTALKQNQTTLVRVFLSAGIGLLAFSILRLSLGTLFAERLVWFEFWEEMIQLLVISTVAFLLWHTKRAWFEERVALFR